MRILMKWIKGLARKSTHISKYDIEYIYSEYFIPGEQFVRGCKFNDSTLILTNVRLLEYRKTDPVNASLHVDSILLENICGVTCEASAFGRDTNDIVITYISSQSDENSISEYRRKTLRFPRRFCVTPLWVKLETVAAKNKNRIAV